MFIDCTPGQFQELIANAVNIGYQKALVENGQLKAYLSKADAYRKYGRRQVDRWIREKLVTKVKDGTNSSSIRLDRTELETVAMTSNRMSWFRSYVPDELKDDGKDR